MAVIHHFTATPLTGDTVANAADRVTKIGPGLGNRKNLLLAAALEAALIVALLAAYRWVRFLLDGEVNVAGANASWLWQIERLLQLPNERAVQQWALSWESLSRWSNIYYVGAHFPGTALLLVWLFLCKPAEYARARAELVLLTGLGLVIHALFPLTPPRLASELSFVDTMQSVGPSAYPPGADDGIANQYAAMPSLHVGWALLVAVVVMRVARSRLRWLVWLHPSATVFVVVVTANHYWLDGLVAGALLMGVIGCVGSRTWNTVERLPPRLANSTARAILPVRSAPRGHSGGQFTTPCRRYLESGEPADLLRRRHTGQHIVSPRPVDTDQHHPGAAATRPLHHRRREPAISYHEASESAYRVAHRGATEPEFGRPRC